MGRGQENVTQDAGVPMRETDIQGFIEYLIKNGRTQGTIDRYQRELTRLAEALPGDGMIRRGTLEKYRKALLAEGFAPATVNVHITAANSYVSYMGHREYQLLNALEAEKKASPELTRNEYIHLLQTAQLLQREKVFFLIKLFANIDLPVQELPKITVEAARVGQAVIGEGNGRRNIRLPRCISKELTAYAERNGIREGPLFLTKDMKPLDRTTVTSSIRELCLVAKVPMEKGNPRCLRRLYLTRRKAIEDNVALLVEQALERQVEEEQLMVAWGDT